MTWKPTACVLCSINCGLEVQTEGRRITRVRGDRAHPTSKGYLCEKPQKLDRYQNGRDRLDSPLKRRPDGGFDRISWDQAIAEIAAGLAGVRDRSGGDKIFYYGGGGQGNHLGGALYGRTVFEALGGVHSSNALAQEKTGEFWVDAQLYGKSRCHTTPDFERAEVAVFVGKNPWQSHGFPRARILLKEIAKDPDRALIVIDPRRSETARMADIHLQVRPGADAFLLSAMLAILVEEGLTDAAFLAEHAGGGDPLFEALGEVDVPASCERAGVPEALVREATRRIAGASSASILEDLGIQQAPHSTLSSYLEKLIYLLTGNFGRPGGMQIHTGVGSLGGTRAARRRRSPVTGQRLITGLLPANAIPEEILTDHPDRFRAMVVESANPAHSLADSPRMREALRALELLVVIDVAMTETAMEAHYVLPASSQYEKWEATFFNLEFPENAFHLRRPVVDPLPGTLPEPEIHARLAEALGLFEGLDLSQLRGAAQVGLPMFAGAFMTAMADRRLRALSPLVLYRTMGPLLPEGGEAAAGLLLLAERCARVYPDAVRRAGIDAPGPMLTLALFQAMVDAPSGMIFTVDTDDVTLTRLETPDKKIRLSVPELLEELRGLDPAAPAEGVGPAADLPLILSAGERRSSTANTIFRDPAGRAGRWTGALRISPTDAGALGLSDGGRARLTTRRGSAEVVVEVSDAMQPGHVSLPNGMGLSYPDEDGQRALAGVSTNELTSVGARDWLAGTPWHKHVRARLEPVAG